MAPPLWSDETADELFTRSAYPGLELLPGFLFGLKVGETLEIFGEPSTGKTALLMECALRCILPVEAGGTSSHAVLIDSEGGFDALRLAETVRARLLGAGVAPSLAGDAAVAALDRLRVLRCPTMSELLMGLCALRLELHVSQSADDVLHPQLHVGQPAPRLLLIDSVSAYQWMEREDARGASRVSPAPISRGGVVPGDSVASSFEAKLGAAIGLLRRQRLSVVWSRSPLLSHSAGFDFPIVDQRPTGASSAAASGQHREFFHPTFRLRLRRLPSHHATRSQHVLASSYSAATLTSPTLARDVQLTFQAMLETVAPAALGSADSPVLPEPPSRRELQLSRVGLVAL